MDAAGAASALHATVLSWDYFALRERAERGQGVYDSVPPAPATFASVDEYKAAFRALLLEEAGALVVRGVEEGEVIEPCAAVAANRAARAGNFHVVSLRVDEAAARGIADSDLLLLSKDKPADEGARRQLHALAAVDGREGAGGLRVRLLLDEAAAAAAAGGQAGAEADAGARVRAMRAALDAPGSCWWLQRLFNASTIAREWAALEHTHLVPFGDALLRGAPSARRPAGERSVPPRMAEALAARCNESQMAALTSGLDGTPLILIQGPPGTGKTSTILGLLSVAAHAAARGTCAPLLPAVAPAPAPAAASASAAGKGRGGKGGDGGGDDDNEADAAERRRVLWALQSPWMFGRPDARDAVGPWPPPGPDEAADCYGLGRRAPVVRIGADAGPRARVLVCAPSNSALDEIVARVMAQGLLDATGARYRPSIVRVGVSVHHSVEAVSLEALVAARLGAAGDGTGADGNAQQQQPPQQQQGPAPAYLRDGLRRAILSEALVVFCTLSFAGSSLLRRSAAERPFDVVIVDEAAQAVEPSVLVPLVTAGCAQAYLVGDPVQLPATVISSAAAAAGYERSMFSRLMSAGYPVRMLAVQYRMHPAISAFPNVTFYGGRLVDGEGVEARTSRPWHARRCLGPFALYDVRGREAVPPGSASLVNRAEAAFVIELYRVMRRAIPEVRDGTLSVAAVSPYKAQARLLRELFDAALGGQAAARAVDVNTIDGFQGREKDIVIFSCVRSSDPSRRRGIGFVADERRVNVGLTRARCGLIVVGNARSLCIDPRWRALVASALGRGVCWSAPRPFDAALDAIASGAAAPNPDTHGARERLGLGSDTRLDEGDDDGGEDGAGGGGGGGGGGKGGSGKGPVAVDDFYGADVVVDDAYFGDGGEAAAATAAAVEEAMAVDDENTKSAKTTKKRTRR